jgi:hypothetical protein
MATESETLSIRAASHLSNCCGLGGYFTRRHEVAKVRSAKIDSAKNLFAFPGILL